MANEHERLKEKENKNMLLKRAVTQLSFLILSIKCLMRHVELHVSENLLVNDKITASCRRNMCRKHYVKLNKTTKMNCEKLLGWGQVFKNPQLQSVLIFLVEVSPSVLPFVVLCCLYLLLTF